MPEFAISADPIFGTYALWVGTLLAIAGVILFVLGALLKRDVSQVWLTYRGWLIMIPTLFGTDMLGRTASVLGVAALSVVSFKEFARATGLYKDWWHTCTVYLGIAGLAIATLLPDPTTGANGWHGLFRTMPVYVIALLMIIPVIRNKTDGQLQQVSLSIVGFAYMGWMFGHLGFLANSPHFHGYVAYLIFAVEINDIAAFTFGKAFGKHQLRSNVSPSKTVEGALGALAVAMALPWVLHFSFPHFGTTELILTGLIVGIGGQLGDLTLSFIKRDLGVKDMGQSIPGHGGFLDRVDSLIIVGPLFFHMDRGFHGI